MDFLLFLGSSFLSALLVGAARANLNAEPAADGTLADNSPPAVVVALPSTQIPPPPPVPWDQNKRQAELPPALPSGRLDALFRSFQTDVLQPSTDDVMVLLRDLPAVRKSPPGTPGPDAVPSPPPPMLPPRPSTTRIISPPPPLRGNNSLDVQAAGANE